MGRLKPIPPERLTPAQRRVVDSRPGAMARGPWSAWVHAPDLSACVVPLMDYFRTKSSLPPRLMELATLVPIRAWTAQFAWILHEKLALEAGLDPDVVEAIKHRRQPIFTKSDEAVVYAIATELIEAKSVEDETYARAVAILGEESLVVVVTAVGFFAMAAGVLSTFKVDVPKGATPQLKG